MKQKIALVGYGVIGKVTAKVLGIPRKDCFDREDKQKWGYDYYILCLPSLNTYDSTPYLSVAYEIQDLSAIGQWLGDIRRHDPKATVILRSTVLPGTTREYAKVYKLKIVYIPEFLTEKTATKDEKKPEFLVIGSKSEALGRKVLGLFDVGHCKPKKVIFTDTTTAELIKYTMNSFFALKVIFGNQMYDVAKEVKADYKKLVSVLESHKWGSKNGWNVWQGGYRGYGGHCLPKDTEAFRQKFNLPLVDTMIRINKGLLNEKK